ncbi:uncharacterized protein I303_101986 [Kwoniella dejecticola CBS 10117]|uniref:RING-type domain-containing protein n=1 Tax=Kwoniella dejecticola CBS 10117 TaxID=1296121 RepID=A0A1A6AC86_9TREE|nr:uncharacterized protein I303_01877 [Kwoniella dejecticola CBS 10117]OBR87669.1 hypothetical protein I303_01877 [Kwoniella dejecticola CBS 10117]
MQPSNSSSSNIFHLPLHSDQIYNTRSSPVLHSNNRLTQSNSAFTGEDQLIRLRSSAHRQVFPPAVVPPTQTRSPHTAQAQASDYSLDQAYHRFHVSSNRPLSISINPREACERVRVEVSGSGHTTTTYQPDYRARRHSVSVPTISAENTGAAQLPTAGPRAHTAQPISRLSSQVTTSHQPESQHHAQPPPQRTTSNSSATPVAPQHSPSHSILANQATVNPTQPTHTQTSTARPDPRARRRSVTWELPADHVENHSRPSRHRPRHTHTQLDTITPAPTPTRSSTPTQRESSHHHHHYPTASVRRHSIAIFPERFAIEQGNPDPSQSTASATPTQRGSERHTPSRDHSSAITPVRIANEHNQPISSQTTAATTPTQRESTQHRRSSRRPQSVAVPPERPSAGHGNAGSSQPTAPTTVPQETSIDHRNRMMQRYPPLAVNALPNPNVSLPPRSPPKYPNTGLSYNTPDTYGRRVVAPGVYDNGRRPDSPAPYTTEFDTIYQIHAREQAEENRRQHQLLRQTKPHYGSLGNRSIRGEVDPRRSSSPVAGPEDRRRTRRYQDPDELDESRPVPWEPHSQPRAQAPTQPQEHPQSQVLSRGQTPQTRPEEHRSRRESTTSRATPSAPVSGSGERSRGSSHSARSVEVPAAPQPQPLRATAPEFQHRAHRTTATDSTAVAPQSRSTRPLVVANPDDETHHPILEGTAPAAVVPDRAHERNRHPEGPRPPRVKKSSERHRSTSDEPREAVRPPALLASRNTQFEDGLEEEMTCPVCMNIMVSPHQVTPCGHALCGACGVQWITIRAASGGRANCPTCRVKIDRHDPLTPARTLENLIRKWIDNKIAVEGEWEGLPEFKEREECWKIHKEHSGGALIPPELFGPASLRGTVVERDHRGASPTPVFPVPPLANLMDSFDSSLSLFRQVRQNRPPTPAAVYGSLQLEEEPADRHFMMYGDWENVDHVNPFDPAVTYEVRRRPPPPTYTDYFSSIGPAADSVPMIRDGGPVLGQRHRARLPRTERSVPVLSDIHAHWEDRWNELMESFYVAGPPDPNEQPGRTRR